MSELYKFPTIQIYNDLKTLREKRMNVIRKELPEFKDWLEDLLAYSFSCYEMIEPGFLRTGIIPSDIDIIIIDIYHRNCCYLWGSYQSICSGLVGPGRASQRVVFESLISMYLFHYLPEREEAGLLYKKYKGTMSREELKQFKKFQYVKPSIIMRMLFVKSKLSIIRDMYKILCNSAHPNPQNYKPENVTFQKRFIVDSLAVQLALEYSNLKFLFDRYATNILSTEVITYFKQKDKFDKKWKTRPDYSPNHPDIQKR